jgi:PleD family two-component response regulator
LPSSSAPRPLKPARLEVDSTLAKPIDLKEARDLIDCCVRARLPKRVLIVDDSSTVRSVIRKVLQASRFKLEAEEAEEGSVAIERAKKQRFDLVSWTVRCPASTASQRSASSSPRIRI